MKKTGLNGYVYDFSVDYNTIGVSDIVDNYKYLMKKNIYKIMFKIIKQASLLSFNRSLACVADVSNGTKMYSSKQ